MVIIFQNQKQMAKITDFFLLLALQAWANAITHFLYFKNYGAKHNSECNSYVYEIS